MDECDGVEQLPFVDLDGRYIRMLDAVDYRAARPAYQIIQLLIDGDELSFTLETTNCVLTDGIACQIVTAEGTVFFARFTDARENSKHQIWL